MTEFSCHRIRSDCQCGNKPFGPVKSSELLHKLNDYHCIKDSSHEVMEYVGDQILLKKNALSTRVPVPVGFSLFTLADFLHRLLCQSVTILGFMPAILMLEQYQYPDCS